MSSYFFLKLEGGETASNLVFRFLPNFCQRNQETLAIALAQNREMTQAQSEISRIFNNCFIETADIEGIRQYERLFNVIPDEALDTVEFRRARIINKLAWTIPFTRIFIEQRLNIIFGEGKWDLNIDYNNYTVYMDIETEIPALFEQAMDDMRQIIPANMLIISIVLLPFTHRYLNRRFTHDDMAQFTFGELSQYS